LIEGGPGGGAATGALQPPDRRGGEILVFFGDGQRRLAHDESKLQVPPMPSAVMRITI
jgi:hypothetical protein